MLSEAVLADMRSNITFRKPVSCSSEHVNKYLETQLQHEAIAGPFSDTPYRTAIYVSPLMSKNKADSDNRCTIIDLSRPLENSINYFTLSNIYMDTIYKLQYPTVDNLTIVLKKLGPTVVLHKMDL